MKPLFPLMPSANFVGDGPSRIAGSPETVISTAVDGHATLAYRADIDGLRALAILLVVAFHTWPKSLPGGFIGVDIFFVISGYLISTIIFKSLYEKSFSFAQFYGRRIKRIFPALIFVLGLSWGIGWLLLIPEEFEQLGKHILFGSIFLSNFNLNSEAGYFQVAGQLTPLLHLWSLGVEEQFYICFPIIAVLSWKGGHNRLAGFMLLIFIASFSLNILRVDHQPVATFYLPFTRFWELLSGTLLALLSLRNEKRRTQLTAIQPYVLRVLLNRDTLSFIGLALVIWGAFFLSKETPWPGWWGLTSIAGAALLIIGGPKAKINRYLLSSRIAVFLGVISYPLYLWHYPLLAFTRIAYQGNPLDWQLAAAAALSFPLAWITYRFVESPIRFNGRVGVFALVLAMLAIGMLGNYTKNTDGFKSRFDKLSGVSLASGRTQSMSQTISACPTPLAQSSTCILPDGYTPSSEGFSSHSPTNANCSMPLVRSSSCIINNPMTPATAAIIGDSHATTLFYGLNEYLRKHGGNLISITQGTCPPISGFDTKGHCADRMKEILDYVVHEGRIKTVFLAFQGRQYSSDEDDLSVKYLDLRRDKPGLFSLALDETLKLLLSSGKDVAIILDNPNLNFGPHICYYKRNFTNVAPKSPCVMSRALAEQRSADSRRIVRQMKDKYPSIKVYDSFDKLCDSSSCYAARDGVDYYSDGDHLTVEGSLVLEDLYDRSN